MGGTKENPTYREVCSGTTSHVEVYDLEYEGDLGTYEALCKFFFQLHDPTTFNRQEGDIGSQYASVLFCYSQEQFDIATRIKNEAQGLIDSGKITAYEENEIKTDIRLATKFYPAHDDHQDYLTTYPDGYCTHRIRFEPWPN